MKKTGYKKFIISIIALIIFFLLYSKYFIKEEIEKQVTLEIKEEGFTNGDS